MSTIYAQRDGFACHRLTFLIAYGLLNIQSPEQVNPVYKIGSSHFVSYVFRSATLDDQRKALRCNILKATPDNSFI